MNKGIFIIVGFLIFGLVYFGGGMGFSGVGNIQMILGGIIILFIIIGIFYFFFRAKSSSGVENFGDAAEIYSRTSEAKIEKPGVFSESTGKVEPEVVDMKPYYTELDTLGVRCGSFVKKLQIDLTNHDFGNLESYSEEKEKLEIALSSLKNEVDNNKKIKKGCDKNIVLLETEFNKYISSYNADKNLKNESERFNFIVGKAEKLIRDMEAAV